MGMEREERRLAGEEKKMVLEAEEKRLAREAEAEEKRLVREAEEKRLAREAEEKRLEREREAEERRLAREAEEKRLQREAELELEKMRYDLELKRLEAEDNTRNAAVTNARLGSRPRSPELPPFVDGKDNLDSYLLRFERYATVAQWKREDWATQLCPLLSGRALEVYSRLSNEEALDQGFPNWGA